MGFEIVDEIKDQVERMESFYDTIEQREHYLKESLKEEGVKKSFIIKREVKGSIDSIKIKKEKIFSKKTTT